MKMKGERKKEQLVDRLVRLLARGSVKLQRGQYNTEKKIARRKNDLANYSFKAS